MSLSRIVVILIVNETILEEMLSLWHFFRDSISILGNVIWDALIIEFTFDGLIYKNFLKEKFNLRAKGIMFALRY